MSWLALVPLILFGLLAPVQAQEVNYFQGTVIDITEQFERWATEPPLSARYRRGSYLIYDCEDRHYACVNVENFNRCQEERQIALETFTPSLPCAPLKEFETADECEQQQRELILRLTSKEFCFQDTTDRLRKF